MWRDFNTTKQLVRYPLKYCALIRVEADRVDAKGSLLAVEVTLG